MKKREITPGMAQKLKPAEKRLFRKTKKAYAKLKGRAAKKHYVNNIYAMKNKDQQFVMLLALVRVNKIKAKLGLSDKEHEYLAQSVAMHQAILDDVDGFFGTLFTDLTLWDSQNIIVDQKLRDVENKVPNAEAAKKIAFADLAITLASALGYVNAIVRRNQRQAAEIIASANMHQVKKAKTTSRILLLLLAKYRAQQNLPL